MLLPGREWQEGYRFGFNGKEQDPEQFGQGDIYDYGFRIYNPRLGKFLSVDPLTTQYPWYSPFQFAGNNPIKFIDLDGLEKASPEMERAKGASMVNQGCSDPNEVLLSSTAPAAPGQTPPKSIPGNPNVNLPNGTKPSAGGIIARAGAGIAARLLGTVFLVCLPTPTGGPVSFDPESFNPNNASNTNQSGNNISTSDGLQKTINQLPKINEPLKYFGNPSTWPDWYLQDAANKVAAGTATIEDLAAYNEFVSRQIVSAQLAAAYDVQTAVNKCLVNGKIDIEILQSLIPDYAENTWVPSERIEEGFKYNFDFPNGTSVEFKWHGPDKKWANSGNNSGSGWTAQIKINGDYLNKDGGLQTQNATNETHIPIITK